MAKLKYSDFDIPVTVAGVEFRNPFYVSSGPTTMSIEQIRRIYETGWGAASLKLTLSPTPYINRRPRYGYFPREGYLSFTAEKRLTLDKLLKLIEQSRREAPDLVLFSNITYTGEDVEGWIEIAKRCEDAGVHINELNMGCPNMSFNVEMSGADTGGPKTGASLGRDPEAVARVVEAVSNGTNIPVFVKLSPEGGMMRFSAKAALEAGASAVGSNANRLAIVPLNLDDPPAATCYLQKEIGLACMQGPWALPLGKRDVFEIRRAVGPEGILTATGGVTVWRDAVEMAMCGADLVGICTATLTHGFGFMPEFIHGVKEYMKAKGYKKFGDMRDIAVDAVKSSQELTIYEGCVESKDPNLSAPCVVACPANVPAQGYVRAVADEDFETAYRLITSKSPFQSICGKICDHPCEDACTRGSKDEPLRIRDIKDFVLSHAKEQGWKPQVARVSASRDERVAVIGAGPAGLSAAYDLARAGYSVTVFEKDDEPGGAMRKLIPVFRIDDDQFEAEIDSIRALGVEIKTGLALGEDFTIDSLKEDGFSAIFIGIGAWIGGRGGIAGEDAPGCETAIDFLTSASHDSKALAGKRIGVIGGGFSAVDTARTCVRMGAEEVFILYRRTADEMPATSEEVTEAEDEGVRIMYLVSPKEAILGDNGHVEGLRMVNHVLGQPDESGRRRPESVEGTEFVLKLDKVVFAVSQLVESAGSAPVETGKGGFIRVDSDTCRTNVAGVYSGGDCIGGRMDVISAVADGKRSAAQIDRDLAGDDAFLKPEPELTQVDVDDVLTRKSDDPRRWRVPVHLRSAGRRSNDWQTYREPMTRDEAVAEAQRCYGCGCGVGCEICVELCNQFAWSLDESGRVQLDEEKCVACGMCIWRCPNNNITMEQTSDEPV